jgi:hypothetical protein
VTDREPDPSYTADDPRLLRNLVTVDSMHARYEHELMEAIRTQTHLWGAFTMYHLRQDEMELIVQAVETNVLSMAAVPDQGPERVLSVQVGCLICEQQPDPENVRQPCPGDPH